jgi:hypothetical protein
MSADSKVAWTTPPPAPEQEVDERRIAERKVVSLRAKVQLPDGSLLESHAVDISKTGIGLFAPRELQADQDCRLFIDLSACGTELELKLMGRVCYSTEQGSARHRVGMRFVGLEPGTAQLLSDLLR